MKGDLRGLSTVVNWGLFWGVGGSMVMLPKH